MNRVASKPINFKDLLQDMEELVPEEKGEETIRHNIELSDGTYIDFTPIKFYVDTDNALSVWQDALIYAQALQKFANEHEQDAIYIKQALKDDLNNTTAKQISHTLKGLAANLQLKEVTKLVTAIDEHLKTGEQDQISSLLDLLHEELRKASFAIKSLELPDDDQLSPTIQYDPSSLALLLKQLTDSLLELNPDHVYPIINEMKGQLPDKELHSIQNAIDGFDFDQAQLEVQQLAEKLELTIK